MSFWWIGVNSEGKTKVFAPISAAGEVESGSEKSARDGVRREGRNGAEAEDGGSEANVRSGRRSRDFSNVPSLSPEERLRRREARIRMLKQRKEAMRQWQRESD